MKSLKCACGKRAALEDDEPRMYTDVPSEDSFEELELGGLRDTVNDMLKDRQTKQTTRSVTSFQFSSDWRQNGDTQSQSSGDADVELNSNAEYLASRQDNKKASVATQTKKNDKTRPQQSVLDKLLGNQQICTCGKKQGANCLTCKDDLATLTQALDNLDELKPPLPTNDTETKATEAAEPPADEQSSEDEAAKTKKKKRKKQRRKKDQANSDDD